MRMLVPICCRLVRSVTASGWVNRNVLLTFKPPKVVLDNEQTGSTAMKVRQLLDGTDYQAIKVIGQAFDEAWADIGGNYSSNGDASWPAAIHRYLWCAHCFWVFPHQLLFRARRRF